MARSAESAAREKLRKQAWNKANPKGKRSLPQAAPPSAARSSGT